MLVSHTSPTAVGESNLRVYLALALLILLGGLDLLPIPGVFTGFGPGNAVAQEVSGYLEVQGRGFPTDPLSSDQHGNSGSIAAEPEIYFEWDNGYSSFELVPFLRVDMHDASRTHFDIREAVYLKAARSWELRAGFSKVFWGVAESRHLVDIINQTDAVENSDEEDKLGQAMVNLSLIRGRATIDLFVLPYFRERTFPGVDGRLRPPLAIATDSARYESDLEEWRPDLALRISGSLGMFDGALSHFYGTSREPTLSVSVNLVGDVEIPSLIPIYEVFHQTGFEVQATTGGWLWKAEGVNRVGRGAQSVGLVGGFEYTISNIKNSGKDLGVIAEYLFDNEEDIQFGDQMLPPTPFDNDLFLGSRLAFNDIQNTAILGGAIVDIERGSTALLLEASRRLRNSLTIELEIRAMVNVAQDDLLYGLRKDNMGQLSLAYHF